MILNICFFFFSSRRRHTRLVSDWSSDVCSSDLTPERLAAAVAEQQAQTTQFREECRRNAPPENQAECDTIEGAPLEFLLNTFRFAEEAHGLVVALAVALGLAGFV